MPTGSNYMRIDTLSGVVVGVRTREVSDKTDPLKKVVYRTLVLSCDTYPVNVSIPDTFDVSKLKVGQEIVLKDVNVIARTVFGQPSLSCYISK
jgi:hypothetical protein